MGRSRPRLSALCAGLAAYAEAFDPARLNAAEALAVMEEAARAERLAGTIKALAAARVAETKGLEATGSSTTERLAQVSGTSTKAARDTLVAGQAARKRPVTDAALRNGELSTAQAALVAQGTEADPGAEERLVRQAQHGSLQELRAAVAATTAAADPNPEARRRRIHDRRDLSSWTEPDGSWHLKVVDNPERGAAILAVVKPLRDRLFHAARRAGRRERPGALDCDALFQAVTGVPGDGAADETGAAGTGAAADTKDATATGEVGATGAAATGNAATSATGEAGATGSTATATSEAADTTTGAAATGAAATGAAATGAAATGAAATTTTKGTAAAPGRATRPAANGGGRPTLLIRADAAALVRGQVVGDEVCEVVGVGPVTPGAVKDLVMALEPFIALLLHEGTEITRVVHLGRRPTAQQRSVLWWLYPTCAAEGCSNLRLEWDHRQEWSKTHHTTLGELDGLCTRCHRLKTVRGWALVEGTGKRPFVAPEDPRHPDYRPGRSPRRPRSRAGPSPPLADSA